MWKIINLDLSLIYTKLYLAVSMHVSHCFPLESTHMVLEMAKCCFSRLIIRGSGLDPMSFMVKIYS